MLDKLNESFCDGAEELMETKSPLAVLHRLSNFLCSNHDISASVVKYCETICGNVVAIVGKETSTPEEVFAALKVCQLLCINVGPNNDSFSNMLLPQLCQIVLFSQVGVCAQLAILDTIGLCSMICSSGLDVCAIEFCCQILDASEDTEWNQMTDYTVLQAGVLRCWCMLSTVMTNDEIWKYADDMLFPTVLDVLNCNNATKYEVEQCGLTLCRIMEALDVTETKKMVQLKEHISIFNKKQSDYSPECPREWKDDHSLLQQYCYLLNNPTERPATTCELIITDVLATFHNKSLDRWIHNYPYLLDMMGPRHQLQWHVEPEYSEHLLTMNQMKHQYLSKQLDFLERQQYQEQRVTKILAQRHPKLANVTAPVTSDTREETVESVQSPHVSGTTPHKPVCNIYAERVNLTTEHAHLRQIQREKGNIERRNRRMKDRNKQIFIEDVAQ